MKLVIVGGVAGGATAARARRLSEDAEIVIFERGPDVSFANCGLPYHIGGVIPDREKRLVVSPGRLRERFRLEVRTLASVDLFDRAAKSVVIRNLRTGREYAERSDKLILAPGAAATGDPRRRPPERVHASHPSRSQDLMPSLPLAARQPG